ncbi:metal ABC transporter permease, partial [bacterium]|nr:metal ABC transporter permease [bacterium]
MFEPLYRILNLLLPPAIAGAAFLNRALVGGVFLAAACGIIGVGVVGHRMSYFSNAVSHSSFAGVAIG